MEAGLMIGRFFLDFGTQSLQIVRTGGEFTQFQLGSDSDDGFVGQMFGWHHGKRLLCALDIATGQIAAGETRQSYGVLRFFLQDLRVGLGCGAKVAGGDGFGSDCQKLIDG